MGTRKRASRNYPLRGVTLVEVLIVVAIMALVAAGVAVAVFPLYEDAKKRTAATSAREIREAVKCAETRVTVTSYGPDRKADTADDIRVPPKDS